MSFILTCNEIALKQSDSFKICEAELEPSSFQAYYFSQLRQAPSEYCGWCPVNLRFCSLFIGTGTMPGPLWALGTFLLWLFQVVLPHYRVVSSDAYDDKYFDEYLRAPFEDLQNSLSVQHSSPHYSVLWALAALISLDCQLHLLTRLPFPAQKSGNCRQ